MSSCTLDYVQQIICTQILKVTSPCTLLQASTLWLSSCQILKHRSIHPNPDHGASRKWTTGAIYQMKPESSLSLLCPHPFRPFCCVWHGEPPDPWFFPSGSGCLRLCTVPALILPQRPHLPGNLERICVRTLSTHYWGPSGFRPGSPPFLTVHQLFWLCYSLKWLILPKLRR